PLAEAAPLVRERGRLMQEASPPGRGAMVALWHRGIEPAAVRDRLRGLAVDVACVNAPGQVVLAGLAADVAVALEWLRAEPGGAGLRSRPVAVSAAFHSRLMRPVEAPFRRLLVGASAGWACGRATRV